MKPADKQMLLDLMEVERAGWDALIARFTPEQMIAPALGGGWSVKDVVAHVGMYESWTALQLRPLRAVSRRSALSELGDMEDPRWADLEWRNARFYALNKDKPLEQVMADSDDAFDDLLAAVADLSDEELHSTQPWTGPRTLLETIPGQSYSHYHEHIPAVTAYIERLASEGLAADRQ